MKKSLLLIAVIFYMASSSFATMYMVSVTDFSFSPAAITVHPGDMIMWMWVSGTHTTTSTNVPAGATSWNSNINSTTTSFTYVPAVLGTYQYQCNFHASMGMVGTITVVSAAGVAPVSTAPVISMFPNPASGIVHILLNDAVQPTSVTITDLTGKVLLSKIYSGTKEAGISLQDIPGGTYFICAVQGDAAYKQELIVVQ